jgi:hypothetical protein
MRSRKLKPSEHNEQRAFFEWVAVQKNIHPELKMMFAIPNGFMSTIRQRSKMVVEGMQSGVPDIFLAVAKKNYHGLFMEMKIKGGRISPNQQDWLKRLDEQGYYDSVCYSADEAIELVKWYLNI